MTVLVLGCILFGPAIVGALYWWVQGTLGASIWFVIGLVPAVWGGWLIHTLFESSNPDPSVAAT